MTFCEIFMFSYAVVYVSHERKMLKSGIQIMLFLFFILKLFFIRIYMKEHLV